MWGTTPSGRAAIEALSGADRRPAPAGWVRTEGDHRGIPPLPGSTSRVLRRLGEGPRGAPGSRRDDPPRVSRVPVVSRVHGRLEGGAHRRETVPSRDGARPPGPVRPGNGAVSRRTKGSPAIAPRAPPRRRRSGGSLGVDS